MVWVAKAGGHWILGPLGTPFLCIIMPHSPPGLHNERKRKGAQCQVLGCPVVMPPNLSKKGSHTPFLGRMA